MRSMLFSLLVMLLLCSCVSDNMLMLHRDRLAYLEKANQIPLVQAESISAKDFKVYREPAPDPQVFDPAAAWLNFLDKAGLYTLIFGIHSSPIEKNKTIINEKP